MTIINISAIVMFLFCVHANGQHRSTILKDRNGNSYTIKTMADNKTWMTTNLNINIPGSYCYEDSTQYCKQYGRLYTWQAGLEGCKLLGEGWRLPTNAEWQLMAKGYGGVRDDSKDSGKAAYKTLLMGGSSGFNVIYGGNRDAGDGKYYRMDAHGFYWTATEIDSVNAWFYNFGKGGKILNRHEGEKNGAISVRCVRNDITTLLK